jgi:hypothetical protein
MNSDNLSVGQPPTPPTKPNKPVKRPVSESEGTSVRRERPVKVSKDYPPPLPMLELSGNMPIPSASEPLQYRAIGLVRGKYLPAAEEFTRGSVLADDGVLIDAVLLGRIMSLAKKHLDLDKSHLWVVYPRIRKDDGKLHVQVMGIWDPQLLVPEGSPEGTLSALELPDNYFSVRGEVIFQARDKKEIFVKIRQAAKKKDEEDRHFKLRLIGDFPQKMVGNFWEFDVLRQGDDLVIRTGNPIAALRTKPPKGAGGDRGGRKPPFRKPEEGREEGGFSKPMVKPKKAEE